MADIFSKQKRSEIMSRVKHTRTAPEEKLADILRRMKVRFRRNVRSLPGQPDFIIKSCMTAIFVHGCFWHGHSHRGVTRYPLSNAEFWQSKIQGNIRRNSRDIRLLRRQGWRVITVWECSLAATEKVHARLSRLLK
jgi:DNA mismatch endonuclease, patch repair protein